MKIKKAIPLVILLVTFALELLPDGAVLKFANGPGVGDEIRETYSYFSHIPYGNANFGPLLTAILTCVLLLLSLIYLCLGNDKILNVMKSLSIAAVITSLMPLMYGIKFYSVIGFFISLTLIVCCIWVGKELGTLKKMKQTIAILGDSYSTYKRYVPDDYEVWYSDSGNGASNDIRSVKQTWWYQLVHNEGYELVANCSYSGSPVCNTWYDGADATEVSFIKRMYRELGTETKSPDIILVFGGTNDFWASVPVGEPKYSDWTEADLKQFAPAFCKMMDYLTKTHSTSRIYNIINDEITGPIREYMMLISSQYHIPCILLKDVEKENGHPNQKGMRAIYEQVAKELTK